MSKAQPRRNDRRDVPGVVCFGEVLWDCLPRGLFLGGAPANAGYHLARQGLRVVPVSAVGGDFLGDEAIRRMEAWGADPRFVSRHRQRPTGTVRPVLDRRGGATYQFARDVAWDRIPAPPVLRRSAAPAALVYGTLALRETPNRRALTSLFEAWPGAWRVVDLNFRPPYATKSVIAFALAHAQFVKLNDDELAQLAGETARSPAALGRAAGAVARRHRIEHLCVTAGARGAGLWWKGAWHWEQARPVEVRDTVGAGDAFLGGLLGALLARQSNPASALASASRMGEFVASRDGATPPYRLDADFLPHDLSLTN